MHTMETAQTAVKPDPDRLIIGGRILRRPMIRAWWFGLGVCFLAVVPAVNQSFLAGILCGIAVSVIDLFLMWRGIDLAVHRSGGRKRIVRNYFSRYLLLGVVLALVRLASFPVFWGTVAGFLVTRGFLVLEGFSKNTAPSPAAESVSGEHGNDKE